MLLGAHLRRLREAQGITRETAGWEIRASESKISRMELGRVGFKVRDIEDLLTLYGVEDAKERAELLKLAKGANTPGWWHHDGDILPSWFQSYLGLEAAASMIRTYEVQFIPGLLQTPDYARAVILLGHSHVPAHEIERRVTLRMTRQKLLTSEEPPQLWAVIDEGALRRPIGGVAVMCAQLEALIAATERPNIRIQVIPFRFGGHAAAGGAFNILRFPHQDLPDVVYVEQLTSALYLDKREDVEHYIGTMERLCIQAEPPDETPAILDDILRDFKS
ncbi:XRE family transcriptional regulator [Actinobacteria bacterium YIM 96077]|uniref:Transcriptional regulator n=1 Tax=Phytoactinopolyspora halophila TaxID=1981511 RepID=A0A329QKH2_9ACTN|nr:helix-turn-helix transcriptional regulator [Phytoactinopolyspora halophila]AYY13553.1 XRE family transcriptional regulator [Actinobacteria bacterium YIM 96077]RAW12391.1 transcriptional regulator [Phytoactinopolyspora halophila]